MYGDSGLGLRRVIAGMQKGSAAENLGTTTRGSNKRIMLGIRSTLPLKHN